MKEAPHGVFRNHDPPSDKFLPKFPYRTVRLRDNQITDQIAMRFEMRAAMSAILVRRDIATCTLALPPPHNCRNTEIKPRRNSTATVASLKRSNHPLPKIQRVRSNHHMLASFPSQHVESEPNRFGNPKSIQSNQ